MWNLVLGPLILAHLPPLLMMATLSRQCILGELHFEFTWAIASSWLFLPCCHTKQLKHHHYQGGQQIYCQFHKLNSSFCSWHPHASMNSLSSTHIPYSILNTPPALVLPKPTYTPLLLPLELLTPVLLPLVPQCHLTIHPILPHPSAQQCSMLCAILKISLFIPHILIYRYDSLHVDYDAWPKVSLFPNTR